MSRPLFLIIDGNAIIHRAYHALPPLTSPGGEPVQAVYGFMSTLLKMWSQYQPSYIAACFDVEGGTFRDALFSAYKEKRARADEDLYTQIPLVREMVAACGFPIFDKTNYEADDVIGTLCAQAVKANNEVEVMVLTGDMDLLQLVSDRVKVCLLRKGLTESRVFDRALVKEVYGFSAEEVIDYKALRGDTSDNIPGVPGIGEKTATALLQKVGPVAEIYKQLATPDSILAKEFSKGVLAKLEAGRESAMLSRTIATIECNVPGIELKLAEAAVARFNVEAATKKITEFGIVSLLKRLPGVPKAELAVSAPKKRRTATWPLAVIDAKTWDVFFRDWQKTPTYIIREVAGTASRAWDWEGLVIGFENKAFWLSKAVLEKHAHEATLVFSDAKKQAIGHDLKEVAKVVLALGGRMENQLSDIMVASYILNSSLRAHDLATLALREAGVTLPAADQANLFGASTDHTVQAVTAIAEIWPEYAKKLAQEKQTELFQTIEMPLIPVLAVMEQNGIEVDVKKLDELCATVRKNLEKLTKQIHEAAGEEFNVASSVQLREILYTKLGLTFPGLKKGKTGYSTAASELEKLRGTHPIIEMIEEYRELAKLENTYLSVLPTLISPVTGRLHTRYNQTVAATGRLSSYDPNLQNIPVRTELGREIREAFVARKGYELIVADYSQIELRIVAALADDKRLKEIFQKGEDVHRATAAAINGVTLDEVTKEMRYAAKEINFGVLYGMGTFGLAWRAGISQAQAKEFIKAYFEQFAGVKAYLDRTIVQAEETGYVETLFGRRRYLPEIHASNHVARAAAERMAVNMPVQGTAADIMKIAMINVEKAIREKYGDRVALLLQVHDELVLEAPTADAKAVADLVKAEMSAAAKLSVPVEVQAGLAHNWGAAK